MFSKRCSLCGGKLVDNKCTLCGLDNSKSDSNYKLNVNSCDGEPLTHVHEEEKPKRSEKKSQRKAGNIAAKPRTPEIKFPSGGKSGNYKKGKLGIVWVIVVIAAVIIGGMQEIQEFSGEIFDGFGGFGGIHESDYDYRDDLYTSVTRELSETGDSYEAEIDPGTYIVGVHIPEGTYMVELLEGYTYLDIEDSENVIYIWESFDEEYGKMEMLDVRLYNGAKVIVGDGGRLRFISDNAQTAAMVNLPNPLTEAVTVADGYVTGIDFPAGTYDIFALKDGEDDSLFSYTVPGTVIEDPDDDFEATTGNVWVCTRENTFIYRNLYFPEGTEIHMDRESLQIQPSEVIPESYEGYYYIYE